MNNLLQFKHYRWFELLAIQIVREAVFAETEPLKAIRPIRFVLAARNPFRFGDYPVIAGRKFSLPNRQKNQ